MEIKLQKIKNFLKNFFIINDSVHHIAGGAALGIFFGILPGEGIGTTLVFTSLLRLNGSAAVVGVMTTNMWSTFAALPLAVLSGGLLFGQTSTSLYDHFYQTYNLGWKYFFSKAILFELALPLIVGYLLVSLAVASFFYFFIFIFLKYFKIRD